MFTKNKKQLDFITVEQTRNITNVKILVEMVVGDCLVRTVTGGGDKPVIGCHQSITELLNLTQACPKASLNYQCCFSNRAKTVSGLSVIQSS